jgi:glucokinase
LIAEAGLEPDVRADTLLAMARSGDLVAADVLRRWATPLAAAIDSVMAALDPELVVLGGGLGHIAKEALKSVPQGSDWFGRPVVDAQLGDRAGVIGAALKAIARTAPNPQRVAIDTGPRGATSST